MFTIDRVSPHNLTETAERSWCVQKNVSCFQRMKRLDKQLSNRDFSWDNRQNNCDSYQLIKRFLKQQCVINLWTDDPLWYPMQVPFDRRFRFGICKTFRVSNGKVFCNWPKTGRKHLVPVIMLHALSMTNEPSYTFNFHACVGIAFWKLSWC